MSRISSLSPDAARAGVFFAVVATLVAGPAFAQPYNPDVTVSGQDLENEPDNEEIVVNIADCRKLLDNDALELRIAWDFGSVDSNDNYSIKIAPPGEQCQEGAVAYDDTQDADCTLPEEHRNQDLTTDVEFVFSAEDLFGFSSSASCVASNSGTWTINIVYDDEDTDGGAKVSSDAVQVNLELARPSSPTNVEAVPGETVINVTWDEVSGNQGYQVYVSSTELTSGSEPEDVGASSTASADESVNVSSGVSVGGTYWVGVTTVNSFGNESVLSVFGPVVTQPTDDFWELYKENGGTEIGGYCAVSRQTDARGLFGMFGVLALLGLRRRRTPRRIVGGCILMGALVLGVPASAQVQNELESPISSALEIKLGNYEPQIDEGSGGGDAFATVFGDANLGFELEYDYQVWRGIGSLGIGLNLGYVSATGSSVNEDGTSSPDRSRLNMFPLRAALVYRLDWFQTQYRIPLVLAFKFGLDYYLWSTRSSGGVSDYTDASGERTIGRGATHGYHAAIGGYFLLDSLAPRMAQAFDANSGVNNSYIFAEYLIANIDDFGSSDSWDLGDRTAMFGLAFEF